MQAAGAHCSGFQPWDVHKPIPQNASNKLTVGLALREHSQEQKIEFFRPQVRNRNVRRSCILIEFSVSHLSVFYFCSFRLMRVAKLEVCVKSVLYCSQFWSFLCWMQLFSIGIVFEIVVVLVNVMKIKGCDWKMYKWLCMITYLLLAWLIVI